MSFGSTRNYCRYCGKEIITSRYIKNWWLVRRFDNSPFLTIPEREECSERKSRKEGNRMHEPFAGTASLSVDMARARLRSTIMKLERMKS